ncbi:MAG: hypothetical protein H8E41_11455 [Desulfobulbaceae bacterium]|uniref:Twitching motility protein PilT n=1 Tax=Candidatus Desulfobia pelagia TaxID=2841692 RepID=A0A8J6TCV9_9BACT|nr:hypothetical protein [Candidatus Desulfobia pelagia]
MFLSFHGHLRNLLRRGYQNQQKIEHALNRRASIKDIIESMGVPHTEIGRLIINDQEVSFLHIPNNNTSVEIFPLSGPDDFLTATSLRPEPLPELIFALDMNVGKLVKLLRMAGIDTFYTNPISELELLKVGVEENRIVLSRNKDLLKRKALTFGYLVKNFSPEKQFQEIIHFFGLTRNLQPFTRCMACNGLLKKVDKQKIIAELEPLTKIHYHCFQQCSDCTKLYWSGSHKDKMVDIIKRCFPDQDFSVECKKH